ncbi:hypothetical protein [Streptomyces sp. NPDC046332]|uniref:hypothetical protein n=1 Tax=Streptomyces sp. NPDC046332 TaxID=3155133 RepID=UPI0033E7C2E6
MRFVNSTLGAAAALGLLGFAVVQLLDAGAAGAAAPGAVRTAAMVGPWSDSGWQGPLPMVHQADDSGWQ